MEAEETEFAPINNPELIGHGGAEKLLRHAFESKRMAHAWLITGPKGIGKATLAHRLARFVLANGQANDQKLGVASQDAGLFGDEPLEKPGKDQQIDGLFIPPDHPVFHRAIAGSHADLLTLERQIDEKTGRRKGQIVVDAARKVKGFLSHTAGEGAWRVIIVDSADEMNRNAANALLKVLEEPPPKALILLVCHNPGRLLPTIKSRCRILSLRPPSITDVVAYMQERVPGLPTEQARRIAMVTDGSIGRAIELARTEGLQIVDEMMGICAGLTERMPVNAVHNFAGKLGRSGSEVDFEVFSTTIRWWLEQLVIAKASDRSLPMQDADKFAHIRDIVELDRLVEVWEKVRQLLDSVSVANLDRKQVVLNTFIAIETAIHRHA